MVAWGAVLPLQKKGGMAEKVLAMLKGEGVTTSFGSFSHKESGGGGQKKPSFKRGARKVLPCLAGLV